MPVLQLTRVLQLIVLVASVTAFQPSVHQLPAPRCTTIKLRESESIDPTPEIPDKKPPSPPPQPKRLDPLVQSLTRMDAETASAPTVQVPIWGELILDRSLFVLLPVALFAVLGLGTSIYVAINSPDSFVVPDISLPPAPSYGAVDADGCRGLCSSQQDDLESLKVFMDSLRK